MRNIKLKLEYDGSNYCGWQRQVDKKTIQGELERSINRITKEKVDVVGCSRTDSGVHALGYVANFNTNSSIPGDRFLYVLNNNLPEDIVVTFSEEVDIEFHSRYHSKGKTYCYTILNRRMPSALHRNSTYLVKEKLDVNLMQEAAKFFIGTHDFKAFRTLGSSTQSTVRTVTDVTIEKNEEFIKIYTSADGFLYNMVRIMVGTLINVGRGKLEPEDIKKILLSQDRKKAGKVISPRGLTLIKVFY